MSFLVYLAGPITGLSFGQATDWRLDARQALKKMSNGQIESLDPMRHKDYLADETTLGDTYDERIMSSQRGIYGRDRFDCMRSDLLLVNMLGAQRVSIGTCMEIAWASSKNTPVVLVMEEEGNPHEHAMLREACYWRTPRLDEGLSLVYRILCPNGAFDERFYSPEWIRANVLKEEA